VITGAWPGPLSAAANLRIVTQLSRWARCPLRPVSECQPLAHADKGAFRGYFGRPTSPGAVECPAASAGTVPAHRPAHTADLGTDQLRDAQAESHAAVGDGEMGVLDGGASPEHGKPVDWDWPHADPAGLDLVATKPGVELLCQVVMSSGTCRRTGALVPAPSFSAFSSPGPARSNLKVRTIASDQDEAGFGVHRSQSISGRSRQLDWDAD
jgi:hypothetical protein